MRCEAIANALPDELITELSRLRWLFVTARGSSFRMRATDSEFSDIGRLLGVRYCLSGTVEVSDRRLVVTVELVDTLDEGIVWADRFSGRIDDVHQMREEIRIAGPRDARYPNPDARSRIWRASRVPEDLDAWSAYHLGLQHIYRFNRRRQCGRSATVPARRYARSRFARAHAGSVLRPLPDGIHAIHRRYCGRDRARRATVAERGLELDPLDPFVNFTMGRSYLARRRPREQPELARARDER